MEPEGPAVEADWLEPEEMRAWRTYIEASDRLQAVLNRSLQTKHGMTMDDYRILVFLSEAPERSLRMSDIADGIVASRSKLTHQVRRLEAAGMVARAGCASDKRGVLATLTDEGLRRLERAAPDHVADVRQFMIDAMTARQLRALGDAFVKVGSLCQDVEQADATLAKVRGRGGRSARRSSL
ncbi:MarR family winged helix-turn-helix transcriptional regulator [Tomitella biformata]|uniref:MarR family winged helix-turn-helix transcriptional regulator n=1 Tax=Tomitella biformata TaxID=630403 RepID=UPI000463AD88|nr:MarR family transcriptional regulator [Tomitella biformata]